MDWNNGLGCGAALLHGWLIELIRSTSNLFCKYISSPWTNLFCQINQGGIKYGERYQTRNRTYLG